MRPNTRFTVFLLVVSAVLLADSLTLGPRARIAPLAVLVPTTALAVLKLVRDLRRRDQTDTEQEESEPAESKPGDPGQTVVAGRRQLRITLWIAGFAGLVYLVGFLPAAPVFLLSYLRVEAGAGWRQSLLVTAGTVALIYATFAVLAGLRFPEGVLL